jgi:mono/diheme cytochrome c family protein
MNLIRIPMTMALLVATAVAIAQTPATPSPSRGELLYQNHCVACHDKQVHWRDRRLVTDWATLTAQVRRWQANAGLHWPDATIEEVVQYLNTTIYRFPDRAPKQTG